MIQSLRVERIRRVSPSTAPGAVRGAHAPKLDRIHIFNSERASGQRGDGHGEIGERRDEGDL